MMPRFSFVIMPQLMLPESSSMNRTLGSTELLKKSGVSASVPGAAGAVTGARRAQVSSAALVAADKDVVLVFIKSSLPC